MQRNHHQKPYSGKKLYWLPSDTKELWEESLRDPHKKEYLTNMNWLTEDAIEYNFNSNGFRGNEFQSDSFIALGCSFTMGTGLEQSQIWPELLSKKLNTPVSNLGVYGASFDTCYRLLEAYIDELSPKFVVLCKPPIHRFEILTTPHENGRMVTPHAQINDELCRSWYAYDENSSINSRKNIRAMHDLCREKNTKFFIMPELLTFDDARDFQHSGPISHKTMVDKFLSETKL